jgi:hypothetical protein
MRTVGVDLSAQPRETPVATVEWGEGRATVTGLTIGADDDRIARLIDGADKTGIDAPFGWSSEFVEFVTRHRHGEPHPYRLDTVDRRRPCSCATPISTSRPQQVSIPLASPPRRSRLWLCDAQGFCSCYIRMIESPDPSSRYIPPRRSLVNGQLELPVGGREICS